MLAAISRSLLVSEWPSRPPLRGGGAHNPGEGSKFEFPASSAWFWLRESSLMVLLEVSTSNGMSLTTVSASELSEAAIKLLTSEGDAAASLADGPMGRLI